MSLIIFDRNTAAYFNSFGIEYIPQWILNKIKCKPIAHNAFRRKYMVDEASIEFRLRKIDEQEIIF